MEQFDWWFSHARAALELLYFASGIAIAVAAFWGLQQLKAAAAQVKIASEQLKLTRDIANTNVKREASKLAAEQCLYFAEEIVPAYMALVTKYQTSHLTFLHARVNPNEPQFVIENGEFTKVNCNLALFQKEMATVDREIIKYVNGLEYFAILFAAGVADEDIGYRETALAFCQGVDFCMAALYNLRTTNQGRYDSTIKLFEIWKRRTTARQMAPFMSSMQALIKQAESDKIKILGEA